MYEDRIEEVIDLWEELLESTENFALWGEGDFDQGLFRETLYKTWKLFSERIDFDSPENEYVLPIGLAEILGQILTYSKLQQITPRDDGGDIELSAMIAGDLFYNIKYRDMFVREKPIVTDRHMIDGEILRLTYYLDTGELKVEDGHSDEITDFVCDPNDGGISAITPQTKTKEPIIVKDISRWRGEFENLLYEND